MTPFGSLRAVVFLRCGHRRRRLRLRNSPRRRRIWSGPPCRQWRRFVGFVYTGGRLVTIVINYAGVVVFPRFDDSY